MNISSLNATSGRVPLVLTGVAGQTANLFEINDVGDQSGNKFVVQFNGNVGIGTTSPGAKLDVIGSVFVKSAIKLYGNVSQGYLVNSNTAGSWGDIEGAGDTLLRSDNNLVLTARNNSNGNIIFGTQSPSTEKMRITTNGSVGIGTIGPVRKLHVAETTGSTDYGASIKLTNNSTGHLVTDGVDIGLGDGTSLYLMNRENAPIKFGTNGVVNMTILAGGNVGIGTTSPSSAGLVVANDVSGAAIDVVSKRIINVGTPSADSDAVNKAYVDTAISAAAGASNSLLSYLFIGM